MEAIVCPIDKGGLHLSDYHEELKINSTLKLRNLLKGQPEFLQEFFRGIRDTTSARTRIGYAYDLKLFFSFLMENKQDFKDKLLNGLTLDDLVMVTPDDIEIYMEYVSYYEKNHKRTTLKRTNEESGKSRKLASIRTLFTYFFKKRKVPSNPAALVDFPKTHDKVITRLEINEVVKLLDEAEYGEHLTETQKKYHQITCKRDLAIISVLLGTGIRLSECVGINLDHIDFETGGIKITRKGGNEVIVYFGEEVEEALNDYLKERKQIEPLTGHEDALFLSMQRRRITDRSIQLLVKKYAKPAASLKTISPHKLRSTYGTNLYRETGDIYLVADALGHSDVNTTRKHYAEIGEDQRRKAAKHIKLRKE